MHGFNLRFLSLSVETRNHLVFQKTYDNKDEGNIFAVEGQGNIQSESSFYEEPDSPYQMPILQQTPVLRDATNSSLQNYTPPAKVEKPNGLGEPCMQETEDSWGLELNVTTENYSLAGRGSNFTSSLLRRNRKQPVRTIREFPLCKNKRQPEAEAP